MRAIARHSFLKKVMNLNDRGTHPVEPSHTVRPGPSSPYHRDEQVSARMAAVDFGASAGHAGVQFR